MGRREEHRAALRALDDDDVRAYLAAHSGLPGPRGNLELIDAFADVAPGPLVRALADVRTLRQALGYCWSVAVAGDPAAGLPAFAALRAGTGDDADVAWVVRENEKKSRLRRLLD
jgi:hypothetical protein